LLDDLIGSGTPKVLDVGCGTGIASRLFAARGCAVLGVDQAEAAMWRAGVSPSEPTHHAAYLVVGALAAEQLALGFHVIVGAVNGPEPTRAQWRELAAQMGADLKFIVVDCRDDRIFRDRLAHRISHIEGFPESTWKGVLRRRAEFPPWTDVRLSIDSVNSRDANLQAALEYLSRDVGPHPATGVD
jgi:predicted kinase